MIDIAIIGAGVSGLTAAYELTRSGHRVVVLEKSSGLSGRAGTRRHGAVCVDHGANFFRTTDPEIAHLIHEVLPTDELVEVNGEVWTFDRSGAILPGDPVQNKEPKYSYRRGINTLGKLLQAASGVEVRREVLIAGLEREEEHWLLRDSGGSSQGLFDVVITTAPAPQAMQILRASEITEPLQTTLLDALRVSRYHAQFSFILGYDDSLSPSRGFHALVNSDGGHAVSWLSFEEDKPGHVPLGSSVLVVQMSPSWTSRRVEYPPEDILPEILENVRALLPEVEQMPDWWDSQRWMLASPRSAVDLESLRTGEKESLFFAGDGLCGSGRVPLAISSGLESARRVRAKIESPPDA
ncbi:MAG TPA: NAD/FAD-dependent oxidoreductase [Opitutae bacterium]|nr:NAD/FAD-dependent oxidoreductase [Opitutae bacterium]|tara:strand:- start:2830 stop:3888 length:1059 start_codon:yes stop_codon:yes gene_type:complete